MEPPNGELESAFTNEKSLYLINQKLVSREKSLIKLKKVRKKFITGGSAVIYVLHGVSSIKSVK